MKGNIKLLHGGDIVYKEIKTRRAPAGPEKELEEQGEEEDALSWIMKMKKSEAKRERSSLVELGKRDRLPAAKDATAEGLFVLHNHDDFQAGSSEVLVLKDTPVLVEQAAESDGEVGEAVRGELISTRLSEKRLLEKNLKSKQQAKGYKGYDEYAETESGKRGLLYQYDEDSDDCSATAAGSSKGRKGFVVGQKLSSSNPKEASLPTASLLEAEGQAATQTMKDFYTAEEMRHVPRVPILRNLRKRELDSVTDTQPAQVAPASDALLDEEQEELQKALERARRATLAKGKARHEAGLASLVKRKLDVEPLAQGKSSGLVISEVTEFVNRVATATVSTRKTESDKQSQQSASLASTHSTLQEASEPAQIEHVPIASISQHETQREDELSVHEPMIQDEPLVSHGIGATLQLLRRKGVLLDSTLAQQQESTEFVHRQKWLAEQAILGSTYDVQLKKDKLALRGSNVSKSGHAAKREREEVEKKAAKLIADRERERQKRVEERLKDYKPQARLEYFDDAGRVLNAKDAFRQLSHKFHGISSGKNKTEKKLKKIENELLMQKMSASDTPLHTASALLEKQKSLGTAHIVLSSGFKLATAGVPPMRLIESRVAATATAAAAAASGNRGGARSMLSMASQDEKSSALNTTTMDSLLPTEDSSTSNVSSKPRIFGMTRRT